jgi:curved DNA-binding protein
MEFKDYYAILGLTRTATEDEIKRSYRKLARKYHPDVSKEPQAEERFKEIQEAYEVLKDPKKRGAYDQLGANWKNGQDFRPPPGWQSAGGFEDIFAGGGGADDLGEFSDFFSMLFGRHARGGGAGGFQHRAHQPFGGGFQHREEPGQDQRAKIQITLEEAYEGGAKTIQLQVPTADAHGRVQYGQRTLKVNIPKGISSGQQLRLAGQGVNRGNLYLEVEVEPHRLFSLQGHDVYLTLPITPWEAALGTKVAVPTLGGKVELKIAPGSQGGQKLRLKNRGLPGKPQAGDQYVVLQILTPPAQTEAQRVLYEELAKALPFDPRKNL